MGGEDPHSPRPRSPSEDCEGSIRVCSPTPERTQCHEPCSSSTPYTMRPHRDFDRHHDLDDLDDGDEEEDDEDPEIDPGQEENPELDLEKVDREEVIKEVHPQLQIRRDLHQPYLKPSSSSEFGLFGSFRKRHLDEDGASMPPIMSGRRTPPPLSLRMHPSHLPLPSNYVPSPRVSMITQDVPIPPSPPILKPPDLPSTSSLIQSTTGLLPPSSSGSQLHNPQHLAPGPSISSSIQLPTNLSRGATGGVIHAPPNKFVLDPQPSTSGNFASDLSMKKSDPVVALRPPPPPNPPKKAGFTIEDIMRR